MNLREYLIEYRALTLDMMEETCQYGCIYSFLEERGEILNAINEKGFSRDEIKKVWNSLNLTALEEDFESIYKKEKVKVKVKIEKLKKARQINAYSNIENISRVFNKSV